MDSTARHRAPARSRPPQTTPGLGAELRESLVLLLGLSLGVTVGLTTVAAGRALRAGLSRARPRDRARARPRPARALRRPARPRAHASRAPSSSTARSAWAATPRRCSQAAPQCRLVGLDRDPEALRRSGERLAPYAERTTLVHAVYDELPERARRPRARLRARRAVRPRRQLAAARRGRPRLRLRPGRPARHADGPDPRRDRRRRRQRLRRQGARPGAQGVRRGALRRPGSPTRSSASGPRSRSPAPPGWPSWCAPRSPPRPAARAATPRSGRSRRCASK